MASHLPLRRVPGVYMILNSVNGHCYVGSTSNLYRRHWQHFHALKSVTHCNHHLQCAYNLYGRDVFVFAVLEYLPLDERIILSREQHYIDLLKPEYNLAPQAGRILPAGSKANPEGVKKSAATRKAMYARGELVSYLKGKPIHPNRSAAVIRQNKELLNRPDIVARRVESFKTKRAARHLVDPDTGKQSPSHVGKRVASRKASGRPWLSPEAIAKREATKRAKREISPTYGQAADRKHSPESRAKIGAASTGRKHSPESRAKIGAAHMGKKLSPEAIAKREATKRAKREAAPANTEAKRQEALNRLVAPDTSTLADLDITAITPRSLWDDLP